MERQNENERDKEKGEANNSSVTAYVLHKDIFKLLDFIERLKNEKDQIVFDMNQIEKLKFELAYMLILLQLSYTNLDGFIAKMSCKARRVDDLVHSVFYRHGDDMLVEHGVDHVVPPRILENIKSYINSHHHSKSSANLTEEQLLDLLDALLMNLHYLSKCCAELIFPSMTQYEVLQNVCGNLRDFHSLKVNGCIEHEAIEYVLPHFQLMAERVGHFCLDLLSYQLNDERQELYETYAFDGRIKVPEKLNSMLAHLLVKIIPVELGVMQICSTNLKALEPEEVGRFIKHLIEGFPHALVEYLIRLQEHMVNITTSTSTRNIHIVMEFLLIILNDVPKDVIYHDKLFVFLARIGELTREVSTLAIKLEESLKNGANMTETSSAASPDLLENIKILKKDLKHVFLKAPADSSQLHFPMSDGPLFMNLLLKNLNDMLNSNAYSVALIKDEIGLVKEDLEFIRRSFVGNAEQEIYRELWTRVLDVAYEAENVINSILVRDHGLLKFIFLLPDIMEKIKLIKVEVTQKIPKNGGLFFVNAPNKPVEISKSSQVGQVIVGFEEETDWIVRKLTCTKPAEIDVISIIGMPGLGKTTLAYRVYSERSVVDHFDVRAWCTVDKECNTKKVLQKIFDQVTDLKESLKEKGKDDDVADKLRKKLCPKRYLIVLDDLWDTETRDELLLPFPEFKKGSRVILTSRIQQVALQGKQYSDPLYLRLLKLGESWELLQKRVFEEESCPDELKDVGEEIARKCGGLPLVLDLIGGVIARKEKKRALWLEVLNNLDSFIFSDEEEVMKVIKLSYDHLSDHLKPCLLYLASYQKDEDIVISDLKILWSAEGLVGQIGMKSVEEVTNVYVNELISSSLVIAFKEKANSPSCKIHDLVHDFCLVKARKERLFDVISSSAPPPLPSSDQMPRGMICFVHSDENFVLFNPEMKDPFAKYLHSLNVYMDYHSYNGHLRHLRLLKRLELCGVCLTDSLLDEIGMLVHLRCLKIGTDAKALPPSFSSLWNLETLVVKTYGSIMVLSPSIWSLAKLRHVSMDECSVFDFKIHEPALLEEDWKLENLIVLHGLILFGSEDTEDIFKRFPNLRSFKFRIGERRDSSAEHICFPRLDVLKRLEEVDAYFDSDSKHLWDFHFPSSLKKLQLRGFDLTSDSLSRVATLLPNLQNLYLGRAIILGNKWDMEEVTFENLKLLKLERLSLSEWQVKGEDSFPVLEELHILYCKELMEIPDSFGDITSLKSILAAGHNEIKNSALKIKEYVAEMTGEDKLILGPCF